MATANEKRRRAQLGKRNSNYRGGRNKRPDGYVTVPTGKRGGTQSLEHRVITNAVKGEAVHHKRGGKANKSNNSPSNLKRTRNHPGASIKYDKRKRKWTTK